MIFEFERTNRVGHLLNRVGLAMRVVVHWIDAPLVSGPVVLHVKNAIHHRVAHIQVGRRHVDLGPQSTRAVRKLAVFHSLKQIEVLLDGAIAVRALLAWFCQCASILPSLSSAEVAYISLSCLD